MQCLYDDRNRVIHRYVISRITTSDVLDIAVRYETMVQSLSERIHAIEKRQIEEGVGITIAGPTLGGTEGQRFLEELADEKHTSILAKIIRSS